MVQVSSIGAVIAHAMSFFHILKKLTSGKFKKAPHCVISYTKTFYISIFQVSVME